jgi:hypothetical protein
MIKQEMLKDKIPLTNTKKIDVFRNEFKKRGNWIELMNNKLKTGQTIDFYFKYFTDWGGDYGGNGGSGTRALFLITAETKFNGLV